MQFNRLILLCLVLIFNINNANAVFQCSYPCSNTSKTCVVPGGERWIDGIKIYKDCWEYSYTKTCNYPSKNDCGQWESRGCIWVQNKECLLQDSYGKCVNLKKEFSCERWYSAVIKSQTVRYDLEEKDGSEGLVCKGTPCIDGNCFDKSYQTNGEMMDSLSKLHAAGEMKPGGDKNFNLFQGSTRQCSKKAIEYSNCCNEDPSGWGRSIGHKCTPDETSLMQQRSKKLCVYVGSEDIKRASIKVGEKHRYCCFGNLLDKVFQVEARKQLKIGFGSGSSPDCRGLTLEQIEKINFEDIDYSEFIEDLKLKFGSKYKAPNQQSIHKSMKNSSSSLNGADDPKNIRGHNNKVTRDSNSGGWNRAGEEEASKDKTIEERKSVKRVW